MSRRKAGKDHPKIRELQTIGHSFVTKNEWQSPTADFQFWCIEAESTYKQYSSTGNKGALRDAWMRAKSQTLEQTYDPILRARGAGAIIKINDIPALRERIEQLAVIKSVDVRIAEEQEREVNHWHEMELTIFNFGSKTRPRGSVYSRTMLRAERLLEAHGTVKVPYCIHSPSLTGNIYPTTGINMPPIFVLSSSSPTSTLISSSPVHPIAIGMMFMRTILALSLAAFALAVPVEVNVLVTDSAGNTVNALVDVEETSGWISAIDNELIDKLNQDVTVGDRSG
ncbi:hypothetical protein EDB85DRAFT_2274746 [Lactarius pseudohatsudake]|nr:hypothetical protein EDB85DRAFT_2274746 [Lactarius pseudohatsudake]